MDRAKLLILGVIPLMLWGCQMEVGKVMEYQDGKVIKITETRSKASTVQSVTTVFGVRLKTVAPTSSDAAPVELDLGLARNALQIVPLGEKASIKTDWAGIMFWDGNKLTNELRVNE